MASQEMKDETAVYLKTIYNILLQYVSFVYTEFLFPSYAKIHTAFN
jgi:hypothetical protein